MSNNDDNEEQPEMIEITLNFENKREEEDIEDDFKDGDLEKKCKKYFGIDLDKYDITFEYFDKKSDKKEIIIADCISAFYDPYKFSKGTDGRLMIYVETKLKEAKEENTETPKRETENNEERENEDVEETETERERKKEEIRETEKEEEEVKTVRENEEKDNETRPNDKEENDRINEDMLYSNVSNDASLSNSGTFSKKEEEIKLYEGTKKVKSETLNIAKTEEIKEPSNQLKSKLNINSSKYSGISNSSGGAKSRNSMSKEEKKLEETKNKYNKLCANIDDLNKENDTLEKEIKK